ncbi:MAG: trypsin-like peptidase domain-containing protein [Phenylobacterium sp.]|uniref:S1 family peptidase n=1 Tax=Phenylobacterium sp. TaxID=1871053 RepID=UPI001A396A50|nr:serine protease [Phenylobacterium sp.]MBL8555079.1 trypsin-like peptidase domain-containing protein [Phenylobacterium sp.]
MDVPPLKFATEVSFADGDFVDLGWHETQIGVLPLVHIRAGVIRPLGTCFSITNDGLCMTARHVIEDGVKLTQEPYVELDADKQGTFGALYISSDPHDLGPPHVMGGLLPMHRVHTCNGLDIALIKLTLPVSRETGETLFFPAHRLRLSMPGVGEQFFGLGYRTMSWTQGTVPRHYDVSQTYAATRGQVEELHAGGRDTAMLPFPSFRTSARLDAGMSGGPLMDQSGRVFGVVCSSFGLASDDSGHVSFGSLVGPAMGMGLEVQDDDQTVRQTFLWEMAERGAVSADSRGFAATRDGDALQISIGQSLGLTATLKG